MSSSISLNKFYLPLLFTLFGFIFSSRKWILFLDKQSPAGNLVIYYTIIAIVLRILQNLGLVLGGQIQSNWTQLLGELLIVFSFFVIVNWESCYITEVVTGEETSCGKEVSNIYLGSEDGALYYLLSQITTNISLKRWLTFIIIPFILTLIGSFLITEKVAMHLFV